MLQREGPFLLVNTYQSDEFQIMFSEQFASKKFLLIYMHCLFYLKCWKQFLSFSCWLCLLITKCMELYIKMSLRMHSLKCKRKQQKEMLSHLERWCPCLEKCSLWQLHLLFSSVWWGLGLDLGFSPVQGSMLLWGAAGHLFCHCLLASWAPMCQHWIYLA